ncbi:MAG: RNA polymerase sigma factor [bacterium]|nr:RNA polymerase sigma factor [bacterium]
MKDEDLMQKVGRGDVKLLAILFERHHVKLYNYFYRLTWNKSLSEDLTQEVFFRILKYRQTYRAESLFTTWMYKLGRNVYIDNFRKNRKEVPLDDQWDEEPTLEPSPLEHAQARQESVYLQKALALLPVAKREVLLLSRFQGMKYNEISQLLGCSLSSVKVQVHRAIKELRKNFLQLKTRGGTS